MSRIKNFREIIQVGIDSQGNEIVMPKGVDWAFFTKMDIRKIKSYKIIPEIELNPAKTKRSRRKPSAASTKDDNSGSNKVQDKDVSSTTATEKPQKIPNNKKTGKVYRCAVGHEFDFPGGANKDLCPKCFTTKIEKID